MGETLKVAVVGCGIGRQHLDAYRSLPELFEVAAVCDVDEAKAREVAAAYGIGRVLTDVDRALPGRTTSTSSTSARRRISTRRRRSRPWKPAST